MAVASRSPIAHVVTALVVTAGALVGARQDAQELKTAEADIPQLMRVLDVQPGMTVADVGAGAGAMTLVLAKWIGPAGQVYSTDVNEPTVTSLREKVARAHLDHVVVLAGTQTSTNLPDRCCDAIFLRDVYHHVQNPDAFDRSLRAALKAGGRLAIIDFEPQPGQGPPPNLPANRTGHGITSDIVEHEAVAAGLTHVRTIARWPPDSKPPAFFLVLLKRE